MYKLIISNSVTEYMETCTEGVAIFLGVEHSNTCLIWEKALQAEGRVELQNGSTKDSVGEWKITS